MSSRPQTRTEPSHSAEIGQVYERVLAGSPVRSRHLEAAGRRVHLLERGDGPPVVLLHGTANPAGFLLPLLHELHGVRAIAPDRPGVGLSDPVDLPAARYREAAVAWLDRLLDALELGATTLAGHCPVSPGSGMARSSPLIRRSSPATWTSCFWRCPKPPRPSWRPRSLTRTCA